MSKGIPLYKVVKFSEKRITSKEVSLENYVTTDSMLQNKLGVTIARNLPPKIVNLSKYERGHILISNIRPYLKKIWFADRVGGCSADVLNLVVNDGYDPRFVYYSLLSDNFFLHMMMGAKGSKMPRGDKQQIMNYQISDLDIDGQKNIASILTDIDTKIALNKKIKEELESLVKSIYDYWFVQFDFPDDNGRPYKSSRGKMVLNEELKREIPNGWEVKKLVDLLLNFTDNSTKIPSKDILSDGTYPVITQDDGDLVKGYTDEENPIVNIPIIVFGDHSCTLRYIDFPFFRGADGTQLILVDGILTSYLYLYLKSVIAQIPNYAKYERHFKYIKELNVLIPSVEKLLDFQTKIQSPIENIRILNQENRELEKLRDWLLPMLMNGQINIDN